MKIQAFQALFKKSKSKSREDKSTVIHSYTQLLNDIESTKKYPHWFNQISLNMMICGLRNAGFKFNRNNAKTFDIIWEILLYWLPDYGAQEISNSLLALDQMGLSWNNFNTGLKVGLMQSVNNNVEHFNAQNISNSLLALNQMGLRWRNFDDGLQADLKDSVRDNVKHFNAQGISNSLLALDQMGLRWSNFGAGLQADLMNSVSNNVGSFNAQGIANSLLAISRLRINNDEILELLINQVRRLDSFSPIHINQVLLSLTWIKAYQGKAFIDLEGRFDPVNEITDSRLHQDVIRSIKECNIPVEKEKRIGVKSVISIDCYIPSKNLVIDVHGPSHYSVDGSLNVKSEKQAELIKKLGFKYQVISYKDWGELKDDAAKKAFIKNLMPSQLNAGASVFRPRKNLDPSVVASKPICKI